MESNDVKVTVKLVAFGTLEVHNQVIILRPKDEPIPKKPSYTFPSQTTRIEPTSLTGDKTQIF